MDGLVFVGNKRGVGNNPVSAMKLFSKLNFFLLSGYLMACQLPAQEYANRSPVKMLQEACEKGDLELLEQALRQGADLEARDYAGYTPLAQAARYGKVEVMKALLKRGADIKAWDREGTSVLFRACFHNQTAAALFLLEKGLSPNWGKPGNTLCLATAAYWGDLRLVKALVEHGAEINDNSGRATALMEAINKNYTGIVLYLLSAGADPKISAPGRKSAWWSKYPPVSVAAWNGNAEMIRALVVKGCDVNELSPIDESPLILATRKDRSDAIKALVETGADVNARHPKNKWVALHYAAEEGKVEALKALVDQGANLEVRASGERTALMMAAWEAEEECVKVLLDAGADPNAQNSSGKTSLMYSCHRHSASKSQIEALLKAGARLDLKDGLGNTALTYAASRGHQDLVELFLVKGADLKERHIFSTELRGKKVTDRQAWVLGLGSIYALINNDELSSLGDTSIRPYQREVNSLKKYWKIESREDAYRTLTWLKSEGHRIEYQKMATQSSWWSILLYQAMVPLKLANSESVKKQLFARQSYRRWGDRSGLMWDLSRIVMVTRSAYEAGYLEEDEVWELLMPIGVEVQKKFGSWREMGENFLDGREIWDGERNSRFQTCFELLSDPRDKNSPWNKYSWDLDLTE